MMQSLDELAETSMRVLDGETIVALDPALLDPSPYADRIDADDEDFAALVRAVRSAGQHSPILVRPNPDDNRRFIIVFGHRRVKAAKELGLQVKAIVKPLADIAHVIAQGQENTARANLSFIEKALFGQRLLQAGVDKDSIKSALTVDDTLLSRMLSVVEVIPENVLTAFGSARGVGRDRWEELKKLLQVPAKAEVAAEYVGDIEFTKAEASQRFALLLAKLQKTRNRKQRPALPVEKQWDLAANSVKVTTKDNGKAFTLALRASDASGFGAYLSENLERLYREFQETNVE